MTNHLGVNGLQYRPQDVYRPTPAELKQRSSNGGKTSGQRRHNSAKWRAVEAAGQASKAGALSWDVLADFYDAAYRAGYGAAYNGGRRARKASAA